MTTSGPAAARRGAGQVGASLADCLAFLARPHGLADALDRALPAAERRAPVRTVLQRAGRAGLRCRRIATSWERLAAAVDGGPAIVSFTDGSSLLLVATRSADGMEAAVLRDPRLPGDDPIVVDRIRFAAVWTGDLVLVRPRVLAIPARTFGWGTVARLVLREPRLVRDIAAASVALGALAVVPILVVQLVMQRVIPARASQTLLILVLALLVALVVEVVLAALRGHLVGRLAGRLDARLATDLFDRLLKLPAAALEAIPVGAASRCLEGRGAIRAVFDGPLLGAALEIGTAIVVLPLLLFLDPLLGGGVVLVLAACAVGLAGAYGPVRRAADAALAMRARRDTALMQMLQGIGVVRGFALGPRRMRQWVGLTAAVGHAEHGVVRAAEAIGGLAGPIERLLLAGTLGLGILLPAMNGQAAQLGPLVAVYLLVQRLIAPLPALAQLVRARGEAEAAMQSLGLLLNQPAEASLAPSLPPDLIRGSLVFEDVSFRYPGRSMPALTAVSFAVEPGTTFGILGRNGAGKSTIARLLQHHATTGAGVIRLDGTDLRDIDVGVLRRAIVVLGASSAVFAGTIRETITAARTDASFEDMVRAARAAGADRFIETLPRGYETRLDEGAPSLGAGQRQRLALARALVTEPPVLVLDEALSALDAEIEAVVEANLREARRGMTTIILSHRPAALSSADTVMVLVEGAVQDIGTHAELMERCDLYAAAWARQSGPAEGGAPSEGLLALS